MKRKIEIFILSLFIITAAPITLAIASIRGNSSHSLKSGVTSFTISVRLPKKAILYPETSKPMTVTYSTVCDTNGFVSHVSRTFTTSYSRNLLYKIPKNEEVCYFTVAAASKSQLGQIVVDTTHQ